MAASPQTNPKGFPAFWIDTATTAIYALLESRGCFSGVHSLDAEEIRREIWRAINGAWGGRK